MSTCPVKYSHIRPTFRVNAKAEELGHDTLVKGQVRLTDFQLAQLNDYWPLGNFDDARDWLIENAVAGTVSEATMNLDLALPQGEDTAATVNRLDGTIRYHGIEVHYFRPLPPVTEVRGTARFTQQGFRIKVASGKMSSLQVSYGDVHITGLDRDREAIAIRVDLNTPVREALTLLNHPELDLLSDLDLDPDQTGGQATVQARFDFPLRSDLRLSDINITAQGMLEDVVIQNAWLGQNVEHGQLELTLDNAGLTFKGKSQFAGIPLTLNWKDAFIAEETGWKRELVAVADRMDQADLVRLGVGLPVPITGVFGASVTVQIGQKGDHLIHASVNLQETELTLPWLDWRKAATEPGQAQGTFRIDDTQGVSGDFDLKVGTLSTRGQVQHDSSQGGITRLDLQAPTVGNTHLNDMMIKRQGSSFEVTLGEGVLDAQPLLEIKPDAEPRRAEGVSGKDRREQASATRVQLSAPALDQVYFSPDRYLQNVKANLTYGEQGWELIDISGQLPAALRKDSHSETQTNLSPLRRFTLRYSPAPQGTYALAAQSDDAGATLRALNLQDGVIGGALTIDGHTASPQADAPLQASIVVKDFTVQNAPTLARILAASSYTGLLNTLNHDGLKFSRLSGQVTLTESVIKSDDLRAAGGAIGITGKGQIDLKSGDLDLKGTVVPVRALNSLPGKIPLVGKFIVGGKGQGLIAINYRVQGNSTDPQVSINPASALTPGFLRGLFGLFDSKSRQSDDE